MRQVAGVASTVYNAIQSQVFAAVRRPKQRVFVGEYYDAELDTHYNVFISVEERNGKADRKKQAAAKASKGSRDARVPPEEGAGG